MFGIGLESQLVNFTAGGTGYLTMYIKRNMLNPVAPNTERASWHGFEKNESLKVYCYYHTAKNYGSEFLVSLLIHAAAVKQ